MSNKYFEVNKPANEPILSYAPKSLEKAALKKALSSIKEKTMDIPLVIGGKAIFTEDKGTCIMPHNKNHVLATYSKAGENEIK